MLALLVDKGLTAPSPRQQVSQALVDNESLVIEQKTSLYSTLLISGGTLKLSLAKESITIFVNNPLLRLLALHPPQVL